MHSQKISLLGDRVRKLGTSCNLRANANHYDVLGITPKATQSDIKAAYYELSKRHHPDKSSDDESAKKFRLITEAYEVLGNVNLKKMYDRGLLGGRDISHGTGYQPEAEPLDPRLRFYKSRGQRSVMPTMDGRTPIYNFDDWSRNHYGTLFEKSQHDKEVLRKKREKETDGVTSTQQETLILVMIGIIGLFFVLVVNGKSDLDKDRSHKNVQQEIKNEP